MLFHVQMPVYMLYSMYIFPKFHDAGGDDSADDDHGLVVDDR